MGRYDFRTKNELYLWHLGQKSRDKKHQVLFCREAKQLLPSKDAAVLIKDKKANQ